MDDPSPFGGLSRIDRVQLGLGDWMVVNAELLMTVGIDEYDHPCLWFLSGPNNRPYTLYVRADYQSVPSGAAFIGSYRPPLGGSQVFVFRGAPV